MIGNDWDRWNERIESWGQGRTDTGARTPGKRPPEEGNTDTGGMNGL